MDAKDKRILELEQALEFYADVSDYPAPLTGGGGKLWRDCGATARQALGATIRGEPQAKSGRSSPYPKLVK